jgi:hypothetical protein
MARDRPGIRRWVARIIAWRTGEDTIASVEGKFAPGEHPGPESVNGAKPLFAAL